MLTQNKILLAEIEGTYGDDPTPTTSANFVAASNITVSPQLTYNETAATDGSLSPRAGTLGQKYMEITFDHELQVNNSSPTAPPCGALLKACGFAESSGVYTPRTTSFDSVTLWVYEEDILWKSSGCRGNVSFNFTAGEPVKLSFTMQGLFATPTDTTFPVSWTDAGGAPLVAMNQSFDWNTTNHPVVENLAFSLNNTMAQLPSLDDAVSHGISQIAITERNPEGSFDPEMIKAATLDYWTPYADVTQIPIAYVVSNGTAKLTVSLPKTEMMRIGTGDRSGTLIYDIPFKCVRNTGDDEISLTFAAA